MPTKLIAGMFLLFLLAGCAGKPTASPRPADTAAFEPLKLDDLGEAPELLNETWLNTDQPLRLANLRGQVVLLDMWTFG